MGGGCSLENILQNKCNPYTHEARSHTPHISFMTHEKKFEKYVFCPPPLFLTGSQFPVTFFHPPPFSDSTFQSPPPFPSPSIFPRPSFRCCGFLLQIFARKRRRRKKPLIANKKRKNSLFFAASAAEMGALQNRYLFLHNFREQITLLLVMQNFFLQNRRKKHGQDFGLQT